MQITTDYRLNANHNLEKKAKALEEIVTDYRLNANHNTFYYDNAQLKL